MNRHNSLHVPLLGPHALPPHRLKEHLLARIDPVPAGVLPRLLLVIDRARRRAGVRGAGDAGDDAVRVEGGLGALRGGPGGRGWGSGGGEGEIGIRRLRPGPGLLPRGRGGVRGRLGVGLRARLREPRLAGLVVDGAGVRRGGFRCLRVRHIVVEVGFARGSGWSDEGCYGGGVLRNRWIGDWKVEGRIVKFEVAILIDNECELRFVSC